MILCQNYPYSFSLSLLFITVILISLQLMLNNSIIRLELILCQLDATGFAYFHR